VPSADHRTQASAGTPDAATGDHASGVTDVLDFAARGKPTARSTTPMKKMLDEFKDFINRGSLVDLAIAVVLATFFAPIVTAIVDGIVLNLIAAIFGQPDFSSIRLRIRGSAPDATYLEFGQVITAAVTFVIVAFVCFLIVKAYNSLKEEEAEEESGPTEIDLLTEIRDSLQNR
jgi:large conductance mechanosensitive channel